MTGVMAGTATTSVTARTPDDDIFPRANQQHFENSSLAGRRDPSPPVKNQTRQSAATDRVQKSNCAHGAAARDAAQRRSATRTRAQLHSKSKCDNQPEKVG